MKGGTVKSNKRKNAFRGPSGGKSFGNQKVNAGGGWQGMGKRSILRQLKTVEQQEVKEEEK